MRGQLLFLLLAFGYPVGATTLAQRVPRFAGLINEAELARVQSLSAPMISRKGDISVTTRDPSRMQMRWPVLRFASETLARFGKSFYEIGSRESPLAIELGAETNAVTTLRRDRIRTADGFSQLIIRVPNPDTVDLDALRVAVLEAALREEARRHAGSYSALKWPSWFLQGVVDVTQGPLRLIESYERLQTEIAETGYPQLAGFFDSGRPPSRAAAALFAKWVLDRRRALLTEETVSVSPSPFEALVITPWTPEALLETATQADWECWVRDLDNRVFLPGVLTQSQFLRWRKGIRRDLTPEEAQTQRLLLVREMVGRPKPFADLTYLYLKATDALIGGNSAAAGQLFAEADDAADFLLDHLKRTGYLVGEGVPQSVHAPTL